MSAERKGRADGSGVRSAAWTPEPTPPGSPLYTWGVSSSAADSHNCFCSCGFSETGWPTEGLAAVSLQLHLGSNHGRARV